MHDDNQNATTSPGATPRARSSAASESAPANHSPVREALLAVDVREGIGFARPISSNRSPSVVLVIGGGVPVAHASTAAQPSGSTPSVVTVRRVMSHSPSTTPNSSR